ncbi:hypothetical protein AC578_2854 [Pseudocercospora eumusae]|uniref:Uncharacterized protein n=1 Tax=Pseudocercospora eumusae TaxID=321146 RepID=A0A139H429_9PEZI|nr:hypothetical protein AC578_2854 [Pseudocercospora eumusae]
MKPHDAINHPFITNQPLQQCPGLWLIQFTDAPAVFAIIIDARALFGLLLLSRLKNFSKLLNRRIFLGELVSMQDIHFQLV